MISSLLLESFNFAKYISNSENTTSQSVKTHLGGCDIIILDLRGYQGRIWLSKCQIYCYRTLKISNIHSKDDDGP
jgi:hypothetical protein